jgi:hypothetical protein
VIGFDDPFGERPVADLVEASEHDDDIRERHFTEGGELGERCQPRRGGP